MTEVGFEADENVDDSLKAWSDALDLLLAELGWPSVARWIRRYNGGASLVIEAPLDALYAATEMN